MEKVVVEDNAMDVFMSGPFLQWLRGFPEAPARLTFEDLSQGVFLHNVLQNFDAAFTNGNTVHPNPASFHDKVTNMEALIRSLKSYYEDELGQTLVVKLPDTLSICHEPPVEKSLEEMEKLLLLILGAAVQCSHKEDLIGSIKNLPKETQYAFVDKIKEVTDNPKLIWNSPELDDPCNLDENQRSQIYSLLVRHLKTLVQERDHFSHQIVEITLASPSATGQETNGITPERNHLALEISEFKAKVRKLNQQLEEKTETLSECKEEMEKTHSKYAKLKHENLELTQEARAARALRDELDILRERANKVHLLETELQSYKDKMSQMESLKCRVEEVREENKILVETKEMLEDQLESTRKRCSHIMSVENELYKYKAQLHNSQLESENDKKRIEELEEENLQLQMSSKSSISESQSILAEMETMKNSKNQDTNILTEQLGEGMSRIHKLEFELKRLRAENEDLKLDKFHSDSQKMLNLETENKKLSLTIQQLQKTSTKDAEANVSLQSEVRIYETKTVQLEQKIAALKEAESQYRIEKETIIENLNKQVDNMNKRQVRSNNEQIINLEEDNKKMVKEITLLETKVNKLERENKQISKKFVQAKEIADKMDDFVQEREKLKSELEAVRKDNEELLIIKESHDNLSNSVEQNQNLTKKLEKLEGEKSGLYSENLKLKQELLKQSKNLEILKSNLAKLPNIESERDELQDLNNKLKTKVEFLKVEKLKIDETEQEMTKIRLENKTLTRSNTNLQSRVEEVLKQISSYESENGKLEKNIENFKNASKKVETLENEIYALESTKDQLDRDNKSLSKQVDRLKNNLEEREVCIEDLSSKNKNLEREKLKLKRDLKELTGEASKLENLEKENRDLRQQRTDEKKANMSLREDLVKERMKSEEISESLENLSQQLKQVGLDPQTLNDDAKLMISSQKNLEGSLNKLLDNRQKKINALELTLKELREENSNLTQNIEVQKLKSGGDNEMIENQLKTVVQERDELRREISKLKVETNSLSDEMAHYRKKLETLQKSQIDTKAENLTLQSQSTSLLSQINGLQTTQSMLESAKKRLEEAEKKWKTEREDLLSDQVGLQKLHDNLQTDYDNLVKEKEAQKEVEKSLRNEVKKLKSMSLTLDEDQEKLLRAKEQIDLERENIRTDAKTLANLRSEHARLKDDFRSLFTSNDRIKTEYCNLQSDYKSLKSNHNQLKLTSTEMKGQLAEAKDQLQMMDVEHSKTLNRVEVLGQVNASLEEDRKNLMSHVTVLLSQYHELLTQTIDDKEHFHEEEKMFYEKMNNLSRQKEKLEEKIMDTYKNMNTPRAKKSGLGDQLITKSIKMMSKISGKKVPTSASARHLHHLHHHNTASNLGDEHDSSSVGSGGNDSLGSGHHSPSSELVRSESALELRGSRKTSSALPPTLSASQMQKSVFRKSMPMHLEDSDGNNADDDSVNSFISSSINLNTGSHIDEIPTRDVGPERPGGHHYSQSLSSHSELGLPNNNSSSITTTPPDNRGSRAISRVYLNGGPSSSSDPRSSTPLGGWKSNNNVNRNDLSAPPAIPARKTSRAGGPGSSDPPQRPPKPLNGSRRTSEDTRSSASGGSSPTLDGSVVQNPPDSQNTAWYEYGCV